MEEREELPIEQVLKQYAIDNANLKIQVSALLSENEKLTKQLEEKEGD